MTLNVFGLFPMVFTGVPGSAAGCRKVPRIGRCRSLRCLEQIRSAAAGSDHAELHLIVGRSHGLNRGSAFDLPAAASTVAPATFITSRRVKSLPWAICFLAKWTRFESPVYPFTWGNHNGAGIGPAQLRYARSYGAQGGGIRLFGATRRGAGSRTARKRLRRDRLRSHRHGYRR